MSLARLTRDAIAPDDILRSVTGPSHGAVLLFLGVVRDVNEGRAVSGIEYSAYESMALGEMQRIADEAETRFISASVSLTHRIGELALEEISVAIAVAHAHRGEAYECSRWVIEELKKRVPVWKRELYTDGTREWVDPTQSVLMGAPR